MSDNINKKKVLLIAPVFFGYYKDIIRELVQLDYTVTFICDAPSDTNISKAIGRINKKLLKKSTEKYYVEKVLPIIKNTKYDYMLLIGGMTFSFTPEMIKEIRDMNPTAKCVMYQWDSEKNLPYSKHIHKYFDAIYSFDLNDCIKSDRYKFLPLFYTRLYEEIGQEEVSEFIYDCSYIGTAHPKKYKDINQMALLLRNVMPKQFIYHYMPSKLKYYYHKILAPEYRKASFSEFKTEKISSTQMRSIIRNSKCVLDAPQKGQTGLTIRTIECLGAKRKIITTNTDVKKYDFYNPKNIYIFEGTIDEEAEFFCCEYEPLENSIYEKYSLRNWLKKMLN